MFCVKYPFYFILLHLIIAAPQLNLYYTDWVSESESESDNALQHNCLHDVINIDRDADDHENYGVITYCMDELPSKFKIENNDFFSKFTFAELSQHNVTSQQLYLWSTPIDIAERYQFYLNQLSTSNDLSLGKEVFYNCTLPRFGPMCQYQLNYYDPNQSSLSLIISDFYSIYRYNPTDLTCYTHLQCNRGPYPSCLDWSEICDGKVDCLNGAVDEEHCWQLEINQCKDNEYRCMNGQCIPQSFFRDTIGSLNCIDASDRIPVFPEAYQYTCYVDKPSFACDDVKCDSTHLTSSCLSNRRDLLLNAMYSIENNSVSENCWSALKCIFNIPNSEISFCQNLCIENACIQIIRDTCPYMLYFPNVPVFFGHIYFAFKKNNSTIEDIGLLYICYNNSRYDALFNMTSKVLFNNKTCFLHETISHPSTWSNLWRTWRDTPLQKLYSVLKKYQLIFNYTPAICNRSNMYQCMNSLKCISIHRLMDNIHDCPSMDDENMFEINNTDLIEQLKPTHIKCETSNKYIHRTLIKNGDCDCGHIDFDWCDDEDWGSFNFRKQILFQTICDGFVELTPIIINGQNETDETECEQWECNNLYTNCNKIWNCPNGADEISCPSRPSLNCSLNDHICVSPQTNQFICLPISKANDGKIDCLGAYDEPMVCRLKTFDSLGENHFHCMNRTTQSCISYLQLCNNRNDCEHGDDEQFCTTNRKPFEDRSICFPPPYRPKSDVEKFLCYHLELPYKSPMSNFAIYKMNMLDEHVSKNTENRIFSSSSIPQMSDQYQSRCHRGLDLVVWLNHKTNLTTMTCLCPPSFYGDRCQYQNQRISLTIKFQALSDSWQTLFAIIISLIDDSDQRIIHSYTQFSYLPVRDCKNKFEMYLVYSTRPKDPTKNYSIHIDIYEKVSLDYRGSLLLPITFRFLPVHRLGFIVDIPPKNDKTRSCANDQCVHGKCIRYSNNLEDATFCLCDPGWSGRYCTIQHTCMCSSDSLCIGISANNQSMCVCPMNKFGSRCLLVDPICQNNNNLTCQNRGQCISNYDYMEFNQNFICICQKGFSGDRCEIADNKLILSFNEDIVLSQSIFIHFIDLSIFDELIRTTTFRTIPVRPDSVAIHWSRPFHLVFLELVNKNYYFILLQETYNRSTTITKMVNPSNHCPHISELFNKTFVRWHLLRRIKYYHLPCQRYSPDLSCFYDDVQFCLCYNFGQKRLANCFNFDHNMTFDCIGQSECENGAQCFQDHLTCPYRSICMCPSCFYGARCQFSTSGFGLSLDAILGYHILPHLAVIHQSSIVQFSLAFTIIFIVAGLINGILCIITFKNKAVREVGCGLYLLSSSIIVLLTMMIFGLKFFILLLAQMTIISNRLFLSFQCHSIDFILRVCLSMDQWLSACVAIERTTTATKGPGFVKRKSKQAAKLVIVILLIVIVGTCIHDPIYRRLIDEENEDDDQKRIWCIVTYPPSLQIYNYIIDIVHFFGPFMINLISAVVLIIKTSRHQSNAHQQRPYREILRKQLRQHRHLFTAPIVLVILALPRLIIKFVSKCMKSTGDAWLFLVGYFISFIPSMLTFIVFVLPSEFYRKEFHKFMARYRTKTQRCSHLIRQRIFLRRSNRVHVEMRRV